MNDCCYVCEMQAEGFQVPHPVFDGEWILICPDCALKAFYAIPKLAAFVQIIEETARAS